MSERRQQLIANGVWRQVRPADIFNPVESNLNCDEAQEIASQLSGNLLVDKGKLSSDQLFALGNHVIVPMGHAESCPHWDPSIGWYLEKLVNKP